MTLASTEITSGDRSTVATFVPEAAMLCRSLTVDGAELLDAGRGVDVYASEGHTMGIPLLYPWANRLSAFAYEAAGSAVSLPDDRALLSADPNGLPIHGVVPSLLRFQTRTGDDGASLTATLDWSASELLRLFPFRHELHMEVHVGSGELTIVTTVAAPGPDRVPVAFGFHPYLRVPGSSRTTWQLHLPAAEHLTLDDHMIPTGARSAAPEGELALAGSSWDDGYAVGSLPARYAAATADSGIALELVAGYPFSQIYAPPGKDFICFEPMTAPTNALRSGDGLTVLAPGEEYRGEFRVSFRSNPR
jgi:aldose 1-epimerase